MLKVRPDDVAWKSVEGQVVLLDVASSRYLRLNEAGALLWPLLLDGAEPTDLADALVTAFGLEVSAAAADADAFVAALRARGLVVET